MGETTVGKILLKNTVLPHLHADVARVFDKKGIADFFQNLSKSEPQNYKRIVSDLTRLGFETSTRLGSSVPLADLTPLDDKDERFDKLEADLSKIKSENGTKKEKELKTLELYDTFTKDLDKALMEAGKRKNHTLSKVIVSGSRGSAQQYRNTAGAVVLVSDAKGKALTDFPIRNSFADGLTIPEYLLHSYGTRTGAIDTKLSVSDSGFLSKQLSRASMPIKVEMYDCGTDNGIPVKTTDIEQVGAYLARPIGGYKKNNEITSALLADLRNKKINELVVRSPITCTASRDHHFGAVCQLCIGRRERNRFPSIGEYVGLTASSPLGEALAQGTLNCLEENTLVRMADYSIKPIKDIKIGDLVLGADKKGNTFPTLVTRLWDQGPQPVNEYFFRIGCTQQFTSVICTEEHKFLVNIKKWSCLGQKFNKDLQVVNIGKKAKDFSLVFPTTTKNNFIIEEERALLLGILLGDGCYTKKVGNVNLSCADPLLISDLAPYLAKFNTKLKLSAGYYYRLNRLTSSGPRQVLSYLKELGIFGKYAQEKVIPDICYTWSNNSIANLISGLIVTDGSVYPREEDNSFGISFSSTSKKLVEQVKELLATRFCIYSSNITRTGKAEGKNRNFDQWQLTITVPRELKLFHKFIPLCGVKKHTLEKYMPLLNLLKDNEPGYLNKRQNNIIIPLGFKLCRDIEVAHEDSLFVLANGFICSNSKHSSSGANLGKTTATGFKLISQLTNIPKTFQDKAAIAETDGVVSKIHKLPQGGSEVIITNNNKEKIKHYVPTGFSPKVTEGQHVEEGDILSEGLVNPADIVKHKGIGEGRKYYADVLHTAFKESGMGVNHRNFQVLAKGAVDHVKITDANGLGNHLPDSIVSYQAVEKDYRPRANSKQIRPDLALGNYLEVPILHFTIGTKITKSVIETLKTHHVTVITVNNDPPKFEPAMQRLLDVPGFVPDWAHQLYSTYLEKRLIGAVNEGMTSNLKGPSPILGLAFGVGFDHQPHTKTGEEEDALELPYNFDDCYHE